MHRESTSTSSSRVRQALLLAFSAIAFVFLLAPREANAQGGMRFQTPSGEPVIVDAPTFTRDMEKQIAELSGGIRIIFSQQMLSCEKAVIHFDRQEIVATGNVVFNSPKAYIEADQATISYANQTASFVNGFVKSGQVIFEGALVKKTGEDTYEAERASFTACTTCPTAWTFSGTRINAEVGGYAYIKNSLLRVADFPIFWLPYLIVPLKSERQTGLLTPSFGYSDSGGTEVAPNFFWAISRSQDLTFTTKFYSKRGIKPIINYRYMLSETSEGELNAALIKDRVFEGSPEFANAPLGPRANRYFLTYNHNYDFPEGFNQKLKLNFVNDLRYPRDFPEELPGWGDPALENRATLTRNTERTHTSLDVAYYSNMLKEDPVAANRDAIHRWPHMRLGVTEQGLTKSGLFSELLFNMNLDYVNFAREDFAFDDVTLSGSTKTIDTNRSAAGTGGVFDPGQDVIRTGQRIDLMPEFSYPFRIGQLDILPIVQTRHTQYSLNVSPPPGSGFDATPYRQYVRGVISARTRFSRIYGERTSNERPALKAAVTNWTDFESRTEAEAREQAKKSNAPAQPPDVYRHEFEPEVALAGVPYFRQSENVFFGEAARLPSFIDNQPISDADFQSTRGIQFDYEDRVANRNTLGFFLTNRFVRKSWVAGVPTYKQVASLRFGQTFDFDEDRRENAPKFPWSDISARLRMNFDHFETNTDVRYYPYHNRTNTASRVRVMDERGRFLQLNVTQEFLITQRVEEADIGRTENVGFSAGLDSKYLAFAGAIDFTPVEWPQRFETKSWSTFLNIKPPGNCWGIRARFTREIGSDETTYKFDFDYNFGGEST